MIYIAISFNKIVFVVDFLQGLKLSAQKTKVVVMDDISKFGFDLNRCLGTCKNALQYENTHISQGERGGSVVECRTPEREVRGSRPTAAVLCPWARHFTPRKYWLITQEAMAPPRHDWKIVDWDVKPQHNQPTNTHFT